MKKIAALAMAGTLALALTGCINLTPAEDGDNSELAATGNEMPQVAVDLSETATLGGCSFNYPLTWSITVETAEQVSATSPWGEATACLQTEPAQGATADILPQVAQNVANGELSNGDLSNVRNCTIDGFEAIKFDFTMTIDGSDYAVTTVALVKDDALYSLMVGYSDESQKMTAEDILASFRVEPAPEAADIQNDESASEPAAEPEPAPEPEPKAEEPKTTVSQDNALRTAKDYLSFTAFSHDGLVEQLEFEGFSNEDAVWAADNCGADWMEQAEKTAANYLDLMGFSRSELIDQLVFEGYTQEQAEHGADSVGL